MNTAPDTQHLLGMIMAAEHRLAGMCCLSAGAAVTTLTAAMRSKSLAHIA